MNRKWIVGFVLLCNAGAALAQDSDLTITAGVRAWWVQWTTFSYYPGLPGVPNAALTQTQAAGELVLMPNVSLRKGKFSGSISAFPSKGFTFVDDPTEPAKREEFDINGGYAVIPGLTVTLGYKQVTQSGSAGRYRPEGPVVGLSAYAPLGGLLSMYGSLGLGRMQTRSGDVDFKADYKLAELGLAYTPNAEGQGRWTVTGGYRIQLLDSKDAFGGVDGRDTTEGFTLGANFTF